MTSPLIAASSYGAYAAERRRLPFFIAFGWIVAYPVPVIAWAASTSAEKRAFAIGAQPEARPAWHAAA